MSDPVVDLAADYMAARARILELEDALRLAEPLLPPNAPWGIVSKVRKALAATQDRKGEPRG